MRRADRIDLAILALIALVANFTYLYCSNGDYFYPDSRTYLVPAHNLLRGLGFVTAPGVVESFRTPGYPLFLVPFLALAMSVVPILIVQHLLNAALALAVYLVTRNASGSRVAAVSAGLIFALDTPSIHYANLVLTETLFTFALFVLFALVQRMARRGASAGTFVVIGMLAGALVLIRPVAILYSLIVAAFLVWSGGRRAVAAFLAVALAIPLLWGIRNRVETGVFTISSVAGNNMLAHRAAAALAMADNGEFDEDLATYQTLLLAEADQKIVQQEKVRDISEVDGAVRGAYYNRIGRQIALEHPVALTLVILRGIFVNLFDSEWDAVMVVSTIPATVLQKSLPAIPPIVVALAAVGLAGMWKRDAGLALLIAATVAYFVIISAGSEAENRFRVPVMPQIAIAAGVGVEAIRRGIRDIQQPA